MRARASSSTAPTCLAVLALAVAVVAPARAGDANDLALRAGFGVAPLPARVGAPLGGYGGLRDRLAIGTKDAPEARAVVVARGETRIALVALDLVIPRRKLRDAVVHAIDPLGIDALLLVATHTHSGPGGYVEGFLAERMTSGGYDAEIERALVTSAARAVSDAARDLAEVEVAARTASLDLAENRRRDDGPAETALPVLLLRPRTNGRDIAVFAYGAHPTVRSPRNHHFSGDYVGAARAKLAERGIRALFLPGPLGDQRPKLPVGESWPRDPSVEDAQVDGIGASLADAVGRVVDGIEPAELEREAELAFAEVDLELPALRFRRFCALWWISPLVSRAAARTLSDRVVFQAIDIGPARLAAIPAEPSSALGDAIRTNTTARGASAPEASDAAAAEGTRSPRATFVIAHANDWAGYAVTEPIYRRGGYEACMSFRGPGFGEFVTDGSLAAVRALERARSAPPRAAEIAR